MGALMNDFEFDSTPTPGTNRTAPVRPCDTCNGDGFVPVELDTPVVADREGGYTEAMLPCPACRPSQVREPVETDSWWKG